MTKFITIFLLIFFFLFNGCSSYNDKDYTPTFSDDEPIVDNDSWYDDMTNEILRLDVTIPNPNDTKCSPYTDINADFRPCTLDDVNNDIDATDDYKPELSVHMFTDNFAQDTQEVNAIFRQKGKSTRENAQKSYRIKLSSKEILLNGERTMQLNKHPYDDSRMRNKMSFDLFLDIPHIASLKTQFINLYINDIDYGLFTHVENVGSEYLANRGWSDEDYLYKAQDFAFFEYPQLKLDSSGEPADKDAFESVIEPESGKNHINLIDMITDINDDSKDFEKVFNKYFNRDNYITWMAINIILANKDTVSQNFYLYNPKYSNTFYFIPWDYDGISRDDDRYAKWNLGISNWWGIPLHNKFLRVDKNRQDLDNMVTLLRQKYITPEKIQALIDVYTPIMKPFVAGSVDDIERKWLLDVNGGIDRNGNYHKGLIDRIEHNINNYRSQIGHPMPFWQYYIDGKLGWEESIDFEGDEIVYDLILADNVKFNNPILNEKGISETSFEQDLDSGIYYLQVIAREKDDSTHYQKAFDVIQVYDSATDNDIKYNGVLKFEVQ